MTARPDLETVKAMLVDALNGAFEDANPNKRQPTTIIVRHPGTPDARYDYSTGELAFEVDDCNYDLFVDGDKLAATVLEWFAAHYEQSSGEKMLAMIRQGRDEAGAVSTLTAFPDPPWANAGTAT